MAINMLGESNAELAVKKYYWKIVSILTATHLGICYVVIKLLQYSEKTTMDHLISA